MQGILIICDDSRKLFDLKNHFKVFQLWLSFFSLSSSWINRWAWLGGDVAVRVSSILQHMEGNVTRGFGTELTKRWV